MKALKIQNLSHRFGLAWALRNLAFEAEQGKCVAVTGPNASGKTTLLKILATRLRPTSGQVFVLGHSLENGAGQIRKQIEWLGHRLALYHHLTAGENLAFYYKLKGERSDGSAIEAALEKTGLAASRNKPAGSLSQGQQKRLALARILLADPKMILLDEPHTNLDAAGRHLMNRLLTEWKQAGKTLVLASHEEKEIASLCDQTLKL